MRRCGEITHLELREAFNRYDAAKAMCNHAQRERAATITRELPQALAQRVVARAAVGAVGVGHQVKHAVAHWLVF